MYFSRRKIHMIYNFLNLNGVLVNFLNLIANFYKINIFILCKSSYIDIYLYR